MKEPGLNDVGFVVVSRNGGKRLAESLRSVLAFGRPVVYSDSGSSDGSPAVARELGADVIVLDESAPHTAARGRNAGFTRLTEMHAEVRFVQFVDGDTTIERDWPGHAAAAMRRDSALVVTCGHLRELDRDRGVFATLFDMEWQGPVGEIKSSGGIAMIRADAFRNAGGFDSTRAAGEEAELCARLRQAGGKVVRLDRTMGVHRSDVSGFREWWRRAVRVGYAFARAAEDRDVPESAGFRRKVKSSVFWACLFPAGVIAAAAGVSILLSEWLAFVLAVAVLTTGYGAILAKMYVGSRAIGRSKRDSWIYSVFMLIAKWPHLQGHVRYWLTR